MARLVFTNRVRVEAFLIVSPWEFDQITRLNAEVARIAGEEVRGDQRGPVSLALGETEHQSDEVDRFCRKGLVKILTNRIVRELAGRIVQIIMDNAHPNISMAYDT